MIKPETKLSVALTVAALGGRRVRVLAGNGWYGLVKCVDFETPSPRVEVQHERTGRIHKVHYSGLEVC